MTYITTHHQFVIDEKHPADVFDEMSNFFSLYTVTLDSFHQLSIGLTVPKDFDIDHNAKLNGHYQNFIKAIRYSIPDANILPVKISSDDARLEAGILELMIQYHEGRWLTPQAKMEDRDSKPKFYQKILGSLLPSFDHTQEQEGLYPQRPEPVAPAVIPISPQPIPPIIQQPAPTVATQPSIQPQYQQPQSPPITQPRPHALPVVPSVVTQISQPLQQSNSQPPSINYLPKPNLSIKSYRELLTQAIIQQATQEKSAQLNGQSISHITLKSKDSFTTAMIETLFASFTSATGSLSGQRAYDAIDLASYGLEELRPQLCQIGVAISDEAQFSLNAKAKATAQDLEIIRQGKANPADIHLSVLLDYHAGVVSSLSPTPQKTIYSQVATPSSHSTLNPPANANTLNIVININVSDSMGERTMKVREFPVLFSTYNQHPDHIKLCKVVSKQVQGELFYLMEQDGQLLAKNVASPISLHRGGQVRHLKDNDILMPNDSLQIGNEVQISLMLN